MDLSFEAGDGVVLERANKSEQTKVSEASFCLLTFVCERTYSTLDERSESSGRVHYLPSDLPTKTLLSLLTEHVCQLLIDCIYVYNVFLNLYVPYR